MYPKMHREEQENRTIAIPRENSQGTRGNEVMRCKIFGIGLTVIMVAAMGWAGIAQNQMQNRGAGQAAMQQFDNAQIVTLTGTVTAISLAAGQGMPSITFQSNVGTVTVMVGPYRALLNSKFEIKQGQLLEIKAFPDPRVANAYVAAELRDASGNVVILRNAAGIPNAGAGAMGMGRGGAMGVMRGAGPMRGRGAMNGRQGMAGCEDCANLDLKAKQTLTGTVQEVNMSAGQGMPYFTLLVGGNTVTVIASPFQALQQAGFKVSAGDSLSVVAFPSLAHQGAYVAAEILNLSTGQSVKLRGDDGIPLGVGANGPMKGIKR